MSFFLKFGSEDQKKVFIPNYAPWIAAVCLLSRPNSRWGHVNNLAGRDGVFWSGSRLLSKNAGVKTKNKKKVFGVKSLASSWRSLVFCVLEQDFTHAWGARAVLWGTQVPKCTPVAPGVLLSFGAQSSLGGAHFSRGRAQAVIWGARPRNAPQWRQACTDSWPKQLGEEIVITITAGKFRNGPSNWLIKILIWAIVARN